MIVADSSPIIILGKQGILTLLKDCFKKAIISKGTYDEIMWKKENPEATALVKAIEDGWVSVEKVAVSPLLLTEKIGQGEKEAISLAEKHKALLLIDDDSAKTYASILGVESHGTFFVIYFACVRKLISKQEAIDILNRMIVDGFYISTELYSRFSDLLNSLE